VWVTSPIISKQLVNAANFVVFFSALNPQGQKPVWVKSGDDINARNIENVTVDGEIEPVLQQTSELHFQISRSASLEEVKKQVQCLKSWENLQTEVQDIHELFEEFSLMVQVT
jgi:prophage tail gpP-like protein